MRHPHAGLIAGLLACAAASPSGAALAQVDAAPEAAVVAPEDPETAEARALFEAGRALAAEHRWEEALERFERSLELVDRPSTRFNVGACLYALERHAEAIPALEQYLSRADPALEGTTIAEAGALLAQARAAIAELTVDVSPADARVRLDGRSLDGGERRSVRLDPGPHVLRVDAEDHEGVLEELSVAPGERVLRAVRLERASARVEVRTGVAAARIAIDGVEAGLGEIAVEVAPGEHMISVDAPGRAPIVRELTLAPGERLHLDLGAESSAPGGGVEAWAVVLTGALAAALAGAAVGIGYELGSAGEGPPSGGSSGVVLGLVSVPF
jgi:hypothetical protein